VSIVGVDELDLARGGVSWISPIARALLEAQVGDVVTMRTPGRVFLGPCGESRYGSRGRSADDPVSVVGTSNASRVESLGGAKRRPWRAGQ
jgi:Transcription elongation factor, GreA/GreB, C-term